MPFTLERDDLRREVRANTSTGTLLYWWPKVDGVNVDLGLATPAFTVHNPTGNEIASGVVSISAGGLGGSQGIIIVPTLTELGEDYTIRILWQYAGEEYLDVLQFDVVLWPFSQPSISLADLMEERTDISDVLTRHAMLHGSTAQEMAGVYAIRARVELDALLRDQIASDARTNSRSPFVASGSVASKYTRPRLILNRERLNRVERKLAMMLIYAAEMAAPDSDDESAGMFRHYKAEADTAFRSIGPLKYAEVEALTPTAELEDLGRGVIMTRVQG